MKPFFEHDGVTIYHGDFRKVLLELGGIQLIATSPPYNVGIKYDNYVDSISWRRWYSMIKIFLERYKESLRSGGILAVNLPFTSNMGEIVRRSRRERKTLTRGEPVFSRVQLMTAKVGFLLRETLIWVKSPREGEAYAVGTGIGSDNNPYLRMCSEAFILASKDHYHMPGGTGKRGGLYSRPMDWCKNTWHIRTAWQEDTRSVNPTPWSRELCDRLILMFSNPGDVVCDPFMGSGVFLARAKLLGRQAIGIDISEAYCQEAVFRCSQEILLTSRESDIVIEKRRLIPDEPKKSRNGTKKLRPGGGSQD